jgi:long-chain acyl-CoA synthetase
LKAGDRVASLMPNPIALVVHYLACLKAGLVVTPLNYRYTHREIDHALQVSGDEALLAHVERAEDVGASRARRAPAARRRRLRRPGGSGAPRGRRLAARLRLPARLPLRLVVEIPLEQSVALRRRGEVPKRAAVSRLAA